MALHSRTNRSSAIAAASARNHLALMAQQIFRNIPAAVDFTNKAGAVIAIGFGNFHIVEESFAERRIAADELDRLGRNAFAGHVEQHEGDALILVRLVGANQAENPVGLIGVGSPDLLTVDHPVIA